jgi:hypothetical protein
MPHKKNVDRAVHRAKTDTEMVDLQARASGTSDGWRGAKKTADGSRAGRWPVRRWIEIQVSRGIREEGTPRDDTKVAR